MSQWQLRERRFQQTDYSGEDRSGFWSASDRHRIPYYLSDQDVIGQAPTL